jgi:hypothetical protein
MRDITSIMNMYRECVRNLWNAYFLNLISSENKWDFNDQFEEISSEIFSVFISSCTSCTDIQKSPSFKREKKPIMDICIVPKSEHGVPISINRESPASGYWDYPKDLIKPSEVELRFIDFFDFDTLGYRDLEYYIVRIIACNSDKEIIGRDALILVKYVNVFFKEPRDMRDALK